MRNRLILTIAFLWLACSAFGQTTTITGVIKDLTNTLVTSGKVVFTLKPSVDTTISGNARFTPGAPITCYIQSDGTLKNAAQSAACIVTTNTSLTPAGTSYRVDICPYMACASSFNFYAINSSYDISTIVPTPTTGPAQNFADVFSNQSIGGNKTFTGVTAFSTTTLGTTTTCGLNGVLVVSPGCFSGSDIGAQINTAYASCAAAGCRIKVPPGSYSFSTGINFATNNKSVVLEGDAQGTTLNYTGSGTAVTFQNGSTPGGGMRDITLVGPGNTGSTIGFNCGGSNAFRNAWSQNVTIQNFGVGFQVGTNCYLNDFVEFFVYNNGTNGSRNFYYPLGVAGAGESLRFFGGIFSWSSGGGANTATCFDIEAAQGGDFSFYGTSFDQCPITINSAGTVHFVCSPCHFESPQGSLTTTGLAGATPIDFITTGVNCTAQCQVVLLGTFILEDFSASARADLIALNTGTTLTISGGDFRPFQSIAQIINGGTVAINGASKLNSSVWVGGTGQAAICDPAAGCQLVGALPFLLSPTANIAFNFGGNLGTLKGQTFGAARTFTLPDVTGTVGVVLDCGTSTTCAKTAQPLAVTVRGDVTFPTATTVVVTGLPFTGATTYSCTASDLTTAAGIINATTYTSGASVTFTETGGTNVDHARYVCSGY